MYCIYFDEVRVYSICTYGSQIYINISAVFWFSAVHL